MPSSNLPPVLSRLSDDDFPWFYAADLLDVVNLFKDPHAFIDELNSRLTVVGATDLPESRKIVLSEAYSISISMADPDTGVEAGKFLIHGISGTGHVTLRPKSVQQAQDFAKDLAELAHDESLGEAKLAAAKQLAETLAGMTEEELWKSWLTEGSLEVSFVPEYGTGYGHLELTPPGLDPADRAFRLATFLMWAAGGKADADGNLYFSKLLTRSDAMAEEVDVEKGTATPQGERQCFAPYDRDHLKTVPFTLIGKKYVAPPTELAARSDPPPATLPACFDAFGNIVNNFIVVNGVVVKDYRME